MGRHKIAVDLVVGYVAGVVGVLITGPLWLVNTRLKLQGLNIGGNGYSEEKTKKYDGIMHCLVAISKEEGIPALWKGTMTSIVLSLNPAIQVGVYELLKRHHSIVTLMSRIAAFFFSRIKEATAKEGSIDSNIIEPFLNALLAKFLATIMTYPIQVVQTQHRAGLTLPDIKHQNVGQKTNRLQRQFFYGRWLHDILTSV
jgi:adenine nucleotide transporter 17